MKITLTPRHVERMMAALPDSRLPAEAVAQKVGELLYGYLARERALWPLEQPLEAKKQRARIKHAADKLLSLLTRESDYQSLAALCELDAKEVEESGWGDYLVTQGVTEDAMREHAEVNGPGKPYVPYRFSASVSAGGLVEKLAELLPVLTMAVSLADQLAPKPSPHTRGKGARDWLIARLARLFIEATAMPITATRLPHNGQLSGPWINFWDSVTTEPFTYMMGWPEKKVERLFPHTLSMEAVYKIAQAATCDPQSDATVVLNSQNASDRDILSSSRKGGADAKRDRSAKRNGRGRARTSA